MSSLMTIQNAGTNVFRVLDTNITSVLGTAQSTSVTSGALVIAGGTGIAKNLYVGGNIVVSGSLSTASGAFDGVQTYTSTQSSTNSTTGALAILNGGVGIGTTADATSETSGGGLTVRGGGAFGAKVFIGGDAGLRSNLTVTGSTTLVGTTSILAPLNVSGAFIVTGSSTIAGTANLLAPVNIGGSLTVTGSTTIAGTANLLAPLNVSGTLMVTGSTTIAGTANLLAPANIGGTLTVTGSTTIAGTANLLAPLNVTGTLTASGASTLVGAANLRNNLTVTGSSTLVGTTSILAPLNVSGTLTVTGSTTLAGTTSILAPLNVSGALIVTGASTLVGTTSILAPLNVSGTLTTSGASTLVGTTSILSALNVSGALIGSSDATIVGRIFGNSSTDSTHATSDAAVVIAGGVSIAKAASVGTQLRIGTVSTQAATNSVIVGYGSAGGSIAFERADRVTGPQINVDATQQLNFQNIASNNLRSQFRFINSGTTGHLSRDHGLLLTNFTETTVGGMALRLATLGRLTTNTNYEFLNIANDSTGSWILSSAAAGTGFLRPIGLQVQNNTGQLLLETSGNVSFANAVNVTGSLRNTGNILIAGAGQLEFGSNVVDKEPNSGKMGYALFTSDAIDFVGGGPVGQNRHVKIWDQLTVSSDLFVGTTKMTPNPGDLAPTSFTLANNQSAAANVTGLAFATATVRSFVAQVSVSISATTSLFTVYTLTGVQRGSDWVMSSSYTGDINTLAFTITSAGQIQYTTPNYTGFSSGVLKFRATTLPV